MAGPLPPPVIQIRPAGLLSLLGLQNGGRTPEILATFTQPTFELSDWYLRAKRQYLASTSTAIPNASQGGYIPHTGFTVPNNQWWWVESFSANLTTGVGDSVQAGWGLAASNQNLTYVLASGGLAIIASSAGFMNVPKPFWLGPGTTIGVVISNNVTAAAISSVGRLVYAPLDI